MAAALLSTPTLHTSFHGRRLSIRGESNRSKAPCFGFVSVSPKCAVDTPYDGSISKFPRVNVWDPYKRLGVSNDASEEEVWSARNFLLDQYANHERSYESIEAAFEKLLMTSFKNRKKMKINLKSRLKKKVEESPPWVKNLLSFVEVPPPVIILRRLFLFTFMACWSVMNSAEAGPAFQVALSLGACIYFLNDKNKSLPRAAIIGFGALVVGWFCGSLWVPLIPSFLLQPTWTLELLTSLVEAESPVPEDYCRDHRYGRAPLHAWRCQACSSNDMPRRGSFCGQSGGRVSRQEKCGKEGRNRGPWVHQVPALGFKIISLYLVTSVVMSLSHGDPSFFQQLPMSIRTCH